MEYKDFNNLEQMINIGDTKGTINKERLLVHTKVYNGKIATFIDFETKNFYKTWIGKVNDKDVAVIITAVNLKMIGDETYFPYILQDKAFLNVVTPSKVDMKYLDLILAKPKAKALIKSNIRCLKQAKVLKAMEDMQIQSLGAVINEKEQELVNNINTYRKEHKGLLEKLKAIIGKSEDVDKLYAEKEQLEKARYKYKYLNNKKIDYTTIRANVRLKNKSLIDQYYIEPKRLKTNIIDGLATAFKQAKMRMDRQNKEFMNKTKIEYIKNYQANRELSILENKLLLFLQKEIEIEKDWQVICKKSFMLLKQETSNLTRIINLLSEYLPLDKDRVKKIISK